MKKFLSLVLALVMTMSLVTISAGAAEYKDLTDKDEIQYEEAVAVLNRIGIITGYSDGSFQPKTELTRGAAAKIIVSLLIGPDAANNLVAPAAPYSDVPVDHTFAGVISYCKTSKIIDGYSDGTFRPAGTLSGYAFSKMLLGALGYKGDIEGFTGSGWTMNVARLGNSAGLFDRLSFKGNESVNREQACQLALNTLKGTLVEYSGGFTVSAGDAQVVGAQTRTYITSNQEFATHINNRKSGNVGSAVDDHYTVEFGEEHFVDLRMTADGTTIDEFGRPSNEWSYKKVTIGTFPLTPDFTYTTQAIRIDNASVTAASKERALGLSTYDYVSDTERTTRGNHTALYLNGKFEKTLDDVAEIADYTDNGALVEVYVDQDDADWISHVAVTQTQLMEIKRIASDYIVLDKYDGDGSDGKGYGFNHAPLDVAVRNVEEGDACYEFLSGLKAGDIVAVVPVADDHDSSTYHVSKAYTPEKVTGALTKVETYGTTTNSDVSAVALTVGGTSYNVAQWNKDIQGINGDKIKVTYNDVTLHMDEYGNAMLAEDVGDTSEYMVIGNYYQTMVNNRIVTYVEGWDIGGNKLSLNLGTGITDTFKESNRPGNLVRYTNVDVPTNADWKLIQTGVYNIDTDAGNETIEKRDQRILLKSYPHDSSKPFVENGIKFIYVTFDTSGEVDSIEFLSGMQSVTHKELTSHGSTTGAITQAADGTYAADGYQTAQACVALKDGAVVAGKGIKAVVIKSDSSSITTSDILYIRNQTGYQEKQADGTIVYGYEVAMMGKDGLVSERTTIYSDKSLIRGDFARYSPAEKEGYENGTFFALRKLDNTKLTTSAVKAVISIPEADGSKASDVILGPNNRFVILNQGVNADGDAYTYTDWGNSGKAALTTGDLNIIDIGGRNLDTANGIITKDAVWVDMTGNAIGSASNIKDMMEKADSKGYIYDDFHVAFVFNDNDDSDGYRTVAMIVVEQIDTKKLADGSSEDPGTPPAGETSEMTLDLKNCYVTYNGKVYTNGQKITVDTGDSVLLTVSVMKDNSDLVSTAPAGEATKIDILNNTPASGSAEETVLVNVKNNGKLTIDRSPVSRKVNFAANSLANYAVTSATKNGTVLSADELTALTGTTGIQSAKDDVFVVTMKQAAGQGGTITVGGSAAVSFDTGKEAASGSAIAKTVDGLAGVNLPTTGWIALGAAGTVDATEYNGVFNTATDKAQKHLWVGTDTTGANKVEIPYSATATLPMTGVKGSDGTTDVTHYATSTDEIRGEITVTFTIAGKDCSVTAVALT